VAASVATLCALASPAGAQSAGYGDPYKIVVAAAPSPYWGYTYSPYATTPLHGVADIVRAQGDCLIKKEETAPSCWPSPTDSISYARRPGDGSTGGAFF
jgi:hypothetical protein